MTTSFVQRTKELKAGNPTMSGVEAARQARADANKGVTSATNNSSTGTPAGTPTPVTPTYINNPDGTPVNSTTPTAETNVPVVTNTVNTGITTPLPTPVVPTTPTPDKTNSDIASTNVISAAENVANTAGSEVASQKKTTQALSTVDEAQANTKIANAQANIAELQVNEKAQQIQKTANEEAYQADLRKNQQEEIDALKVQQSSELIKNDAEAAALKAKQDKAERDAQNAAEVAQMQSNVAFAKLGGSFSGAAINTAQKIFTDGAYNIAVLKTSNAYDYAALKVKINSVAFEHTQAISKLVQDTADKEYKSKERLREFIGTSQNNILLGKKESQKAIQDALTDYKTEQQTREDKLYSDMNAANARLQTSAETIQKQVASEETTAKTKIDLMINNGQWSKLTPAQQTDYEMKAGLPAGATSKNVVATATQTINDNVKELVGKPLLIPTSTLALMQTEIQRAMGLGIGLKQATQMALDKYKNTIPGFTAAMAAKDATAKLAAEKAQADINKTKSETEENLAQANKAKAEAAKTSSGGGGGGTKATTGKRYPAVTQYGEALQDIGGLPYTSDGKLYTGPQVSLDKSKADFFTGETKSPYAQKPSVDDTKFMKDVGNWALNLIK